MPGRLFSSIGYMLREYQGTRSCKGSWVYNGRESSWWQVEWKLLQCVLNWSM